MLDEVWNYYCIYPGSLARLDLAIEQLVGPAVSLCKQEVGWHGWFFIRYLDELGPHIRFRFKTTGEESARLCGSVEALFEHSLPAVAGNPVSSAPRLLPFPPEVSETPATVVAAEYEPEYGKYGGAVGVAIAERLFQCSSEIVLEVLVQEHNREVDRVLFAVLAMSAAIELSMPKPKAQAAFLKRYLGYWSGEDRPGAAQLRANLTAASSRRSMTFASQLSAHLQRPVASGLLAQYRAALEIAYGQAAAEPSVQRSPEDLCFQFVHMMNNRFGIYPAEEAYLAALLLGVRSVGGS